MSLSSILIYVLMPFLSGMVFMAAIFVLAIWWRDHATRRAINRWIAQLPSLRNAPPEPVARGRRTWAKPQVAASEAPPTGVLVSPTLAIPDSWAIPRS